jgi:GTP cyclohydrolase I
VIGLSKINRIVQYFSKRPQVQERLTVQIGKELERILQTEHIAVVVDANHMCIASRGVSDTNSKTGTAYFAGKFKDQNVKTEFLNYVNAK